MKKHFVCIFLLAAGFIVFNSCSQDPIFYNISQEEKILEPIIKGSPTNFVIFKGSMYVASGSNLYEYKGTNPDYPARGMWIIRDLGSNIYSLAVTSDTMYAMFLNKREKILKKSADAESWETVYFPDGYSDYTMLNIQAAGSRLFVGAAKIDSSGKIFHLCSIFQYDGSNFSMLVEDTDFKILNGVAFYSGLYYLTAKHNDVNDSGAIYTTNGSSEGTEIPNSLNVSFMGIINIGVGTNPVVAISRSGDLYYVEPNEISEIGVRFGRNLLSTGALAVWKDENDTPRLLLAGRQDLLKGSISSGYTYGYMEAAIDSSGVSGDFYEPGRASISTIENIDKANATFRSTIGLVPVNSIIQTPNSLYGERTLFASTQKNGVWSYRNRPDRNRETKWHWNAEQ